MAMSDISLTAGMRSNLLNLQSTSNLLDRTQTRLSTGKRVNSALDDPVSFFTAQTHSNRATDLAAKKDAMSEAIQVVKAADKGIKAMTSLISQAKSIASSAATATDLDALAVQFNEILSQIGELALDSGYGGINLVGGLDTDGGGTMAAQTLTVEFDEDGDSTLEVTGFLAEYTATTGLELTPAGDDGTNTITVADLATDGSATVADFTGTDGAIDKLDDVLSQLRTESVTMSSNLSIISTRQEFTTDLINTLQEGADNLTAADMNEEGANMLMLQTRQQLGTTALSLSAQAAQSVLRLF